MFTGIIEYLAVIENAAYTGNGNYELEVKVPFIAELILGQSIAHNGVCLTIIELSESTYKVMAIPETLQRSNLGSLKAGELVNLERCLRADGRFDGHIVQGHVDTKAVCFRVNRDKGQLACFFRHSGAPNYITVEKGSVTINGISLTVVESGNDYFSVSIIPYTLKNTNLQFIKTGTEVNVEFDILGKYLYKIHQNIA